MLCPESGRVPAWVIHGVALPNPHYALDMLAVLVARITLPVVRVHSLWTESGMRKLLQSSMPCKRLASAKLLSLVLNAAGGDFIGGFPWLIRFNSCDK